MTRDISGTLRLGLVEKAKEFLLAQVLDYQDDSHSVAGACVGGTTREHMQ
jgi:hypothetical protein